MNETKVKIVSKSTETFEIIKNTVNKMCDFIRPTFGPASKKIIIDKFTHRLICDDGVQAARDFELSDPLENAVVKVIRETAIKTNDIVGDGTTGALIMLQAIINESSRKSNFNGRKIELELKKGLEEVKKHLLKTANPIKTKEDIKKVALVSFDNEKIAEMIADTYSKLGENATITVDKSSIMSTYVEETEGLTIDKGYISPYMVNNPARMEATIEKPLILVTDYILMENEDIMPLMEKLASENKKKLLIIAKDVEGNALISLVRNQPHLVFSDTKERGSFQTIAIKAPAGGDKREIMEDLATITGATLFTIEKGNKIGDATIKDLGQAERVICQGDKTIIIGPKGNKEKIASSVNSLKSTLEKETDKKKKKDLQERLGMYMNTLAVIRVGASTDEEQKSLKYKVEDAVNSVKSSYKNGVVCGAGHALAEIETSSPILNEALKYPHRQLHENMGIDNPVALPFQYKISKKYEEGIVLNVVTGKVGPFMSVGVMDPVDVLIAGVESAVSIASLLLTSSGLIAEYTPTNKE